MNPRVRHVLLVLSVLLAGEAARAQSPQEKKRRDILRDLGLDKKPPASGTAAPPAALPSADEDAAPPAGSPPSKAGKSSDKSGSARGATPAAPAGPAFRRVVHPLLVTSCKPCHTAGGPAGASRLLLTGEAGADHRAVARFADVRNPESSGLLAKASGVALHGGGAPWPATSGPYQRVAAWIRAGARLDGAVTPPAEPVAETPAAGAATKHRASAKSGAGAPPVLGDTVAAPPPASPQDGPLPHPAAAPPAPPSTALATSPAAAEAGNPRFPGFEESVHPILVRACAACHGPAGPAAKTRLVLSGNAKADEAAARALADLDSPEQSLLVAKAAGEMHAGGAVLPPGDPRLEAIVVWIRGLVPPAIAAPAATVGATSAPPAPATTPAPGASSLVRAPHAGPPGHGGHGGPGGLPLPLGFMLNGRFSLEYERRAFSGDPFATLSVAGLRSYHHFLFLSRDLADDPCGLSVEVLTLQFWEGHCRVGHLPPSLRLSIAGGKIVVPFGADPLYHQTYGGLGGFDQRILPVIWAVEGFAAHLVFERRGVVLTDDLFVVRGYALARPDSVINLQNDFSPADATKLGWGNRLGAAWMFASAWYSAYYNPLGFGRRLFMQALDLTIWRPRGIPVLGHFSLGAGLLRADVSGGGDGVAGPGKDYYHFGSYLQLRYYPIDWLYIQYRQGLHTFDNRLGVIVDNSRLTSADGSTHNFAVVARYRGLSAGLYYFINLDKVNEVRDDLLRLSVIYDL